MNYVDIAEKLAVQMLVERANYYGIDVIQDVPERHDLYQYMAKKAMEFLLENGYIELTDRK